MMLFKVNCFYYPVSKKTEALPLALAKLYINYSQTLYKMDITW